MQALRIIEAHTLRDSGNESKEIRECVTIQKELFMNEPNEIPYYKLQLQLGWSNTQAADFFEVNITTIRRWRNNKIPAPKAVLLCLNSIISKKPIRRPTF